MGRKCTDPVPFYLEDIFSREVFVEALQKSRIKSQKQPYINKQISQNQSKPSPVKEPPPYDNNEFFRAPIYLFKETLREKTNEWTKYMIGKKQYPSVLLENSVRLIFNKLTPENFDVLKREIIYIARKGKEECDVIITLLIKKAWAELMYAKTYLEMCYFLQADKNLNYENKEGKKKLTPDEKKKQILGSKHFFFNN